MSRTTLAGALTLLALALPLGGSQAVAKNAKHVCGPPAAKNARCHADVVTDAQGDPLATPGPSGYGPADLQSAYGLAAAAQSAGGGRTVAIVDAYDDPNAAADLATYRSTYGLPACTVANGCFRKVNQTGGTSYPRGDSGWAQEISLDIQMVSAICPNCRILLVEASSARYTDLGTAVNTAASMGATQISNSYGGGEFSGETSYESSYYKHPGVDITVSSGDSGYGVEFPAASQYVTAVGGTSLLTAGNARGWSETAWSGAGSGCSAYIAKPSWQHDSGCSRRTVADVSAVADPNTGVAVYDTYSSGGQGWMVFGGTSVASPIVAAADALAGGRAGTAASPLYGSFGYNNPGSFYDVLSGSNGNCGTYLCNAGSGYDGPTGMGTPNGGGAQATPVAPANTSAPTITGTPQQGNTLTAAPGTWTGSPAPTYQYTWNRCSGTCAVVQAKSSSNTYALTSGDVGNTITVTVTATNSAGSATKDSAPTATVAPPPSQVVLNGGFETGSLSSWTPTGAIEGVTASAPHLGGYAALLGASTPTNGDSRIAQTFTVPSGATTLTFWYAISCPDTVTYDWATATLRDNTTATTATMLGKTCTNTNAWTKVTRAVTAGHSYTLTLVSHDDNWAGDPTATKFDDVAVS